MFQTDMFMHLALRVVWPHVRLLDARLPIALLITDDASCCIIWWAQSHNIRAWTEIRAKQQGWPPHLFTLPSTISRGQTHGYEQPFWSS
jgi:hypothetical protein